MVIVICGEIYFFLLTYLWGDTHHPSPQVLSQSSRAAPTPASAGSIPTSAGEAPSSATSGEWSSLRGSRTASHRMEAYARDRYEVWIYPLTGPPRIPMLLNWNYRRCGSILYFRAPPLTLLSNVEPTISPAHCCGYHFSPAYATYAPL